MSSGSAASELRPTARRPERAAALALALLALALHGGNLVQRARGYGCLSPLLLCATERGPWATGDFGSYALVAGDIRRNGFLRASYYHRTPGYPLLLRASRAWTGEVSPLRWLGPLSAAAAAGAGTWLAARASGRLSAGLLCGLGIALWPNGFRFSAALRPDGPHAFLALAAAAASFAWHRSGRLRDAALTALSWAAVQSLRPTFFPLALPFAALALGRIRRPSTRRPALALLAALCVVPGFVLASNFALHGAAVPTQVGSTNLACYAVPRLQEELGQGSFHALRQECLARFDALPRAERAAAQNALALAFFRQYPLATLRSFARELVSQLGEPLSPSRHRGQYPGWMQVGSAAMWGYWLLSGLGLGLLARRERPFAAFLLLLFWLVMLPAASSHLVGPRLRLPVDFLMAPAAAAALAAPAAALAQRLRARKQSQASP